MPAASASARRSLPSYQAPPVGRATDGMTATAASFRTAARISLHQRRHDIAAPVEEARRASPSRRDVARARTPRPCRRESRRRRRDSASTSSRDPARSAVRVDAGRLRAVQAMLAEAEAEQAVEPAVRLHQREFVVEAVRVGQEARRLQREADDRIVVGRRPCRARRHIRARPETTGRGCRRSGRRRRSRRSRRDSARRAACCAAAPSRRSPRCRVLGRARANTSCFATQAVRDRLDARRSASGRSGNRPCRPRGNRPFRPVPSAAGTCRRDRRRRADGVEAERLDFVGEARRPDLGDVPGIGIDRAVAHGDDVRHAYAFVIPVVAAGQDRDP